MSFFDPVYQNDDIEISDDENENDLLADGIPRPTFRQENKNESNETLDNDTIINSDQDQSSDVKKKVKNNRKIFFCYLVNFNIENYFSYKTNTKINSSSTNYAGINGKIQKFSCEKLIL